MPKHTLFLLTPWMEGEKGPYYCPDCGVVEGFFHYSPEVREKIEIIHVDFPRPRNAIVQMLGTENQNSPTLVLAENTPPPESAVQSMSTGRWFIGNGRDICEFLGQTFNAVRPHP